MIIITRQTLPPHFGKCAHSLIFYIFVHHFYAFIKYHREMTGSEGARGAQRSPALKLGTLRFMVAVLTPKRRGRLLSRFRMKADEEKK